MPAYCRAETDNDFPDSAHHGAHGPVPIMRPNRNRLTPPMAGFLDAALAHGHPYHDDMNAPGAVGIGPYPHNQYADGTRASTALTHLLPACSAAAGHTRHLHRTNPNCRTAHPHAARA